MLLLESRLGKRGGDEVLNSPVLKQLNGSKRIIRRLRLPCASDRIEEGGFANVWETDDTCSEHKGAHLTGLSPASD